MPYIGRDDLYKQFKLDEPWNSPSNQALLAQMPPIYACPSDDPNASGMTRYQTIVGPGAFCEGVEGPKLQDITDGTSNTIMVVESKTAVPWTKPDDIDIANVSTSIGSRHPGVSNALFADGSVKALRSSINPLVLRSLSTRSGSEVVSKDAY